MNILINTLKAVTKTFSDKDFLEDGKMSISATIIVDPKDGAMPIEIAIKRDGLKEWAYIRFNRVLARNHEKAELALLRALGSHGLCQRGIIGGNHSEIVTDFQSEEQVIQWLQGAGAA